MTGQEHEGGGDGLSEGALLVMEQALIRATKVVTEAGGVFMGWSISALEEEVAMLRKRLEEVQAKLDRTMDANAGARADLAAFRSRYGSRVNADA